MKIYIDESGNSGDNLIDENQRYFTLGAVGIEETNSHLLEEKLLEIFTRIPLAKDGELKTKKIIGTRWEPELINIFNLLLEFNFFPQISIIEKKFMVCAKIVENFFDPQYNEKTDNSWTQPLEIKDTIANYFYDNLSDGTIKATAIAFREGEISKVKACYSSIKEEILGKPDKPDKIELLKGAEIYLESFCEDLKNAEYRFKEEVSGAKGVLNSPNYTSYFVLLNNLELHFSEVKKNASVIFDDSRQFNKAYTELFNSLSQADRNKYEIQKGYLIFGYKHLKKFSIKKSDENIGLQLSDLLATSVQHVFKKVNSEEHKKLTEFEIFMLGLMYTFYDLNLIKCVVSHSSFYKFYSRFINEMKNIKANEKSIK